MPEFPRSVLEFQHQFPDEAACAAWLAAARWPDGFRCPVCGHDHAWKLDTKAWTYECAKCRRQTSVTAGTVMHGSKLSLTVWFRAAYLMATHSNGISARQMWRQLGLGLVRLVTPEGGLVLDPFMGSGTTGIAAGLEGRQFVGIERETEFCDIAKVRIAA